MPRELSDKMKTILREACRHDTFGHTDLYNAGLHRFNGTCKALVDRGLLEVAEQGFYSTQDRYRISNQGILALLPNLASPFRKGHDYDEYWIIEVNNRNGGVSETAYRQTKGLPKPYNAIRQIDYAEWSHRVIQGYKEQIANG